MNLPTSQRIFVYNKDYGKFTDRLFFLNIDLFIQNF